MLSGAGEEELARIANFYDYLEIQPTCNNQFLIRAGQVKDEDQLREMNQKICQLGDTIGKPVVATCDVHFLHPKKKFFAEFY